MPPRLADHGNPHGHGDCAPGTHRLRIVAGRHQVEHRRRGKGEPPAPLPEHRAAKIAAVHGRRAKLYEKRQQVLNLGPGALALLTEITHREPMLASQRVEELYGLLEQHGDDRMREAIGHAVENGQLSVAGVRRGLLALPQGKQLALPLSRVESSRGGR